MDKARENQVEFSPNMKLYEVKVLRNLAEKREDREKPFAIVRELLELLRGEIPDEDMDIEDKSEVEYELIPAILG